MAEAHEKLENFEDAITAKQKQMGNSVLGQFETASERDEEGEEDDKKSDAAKNPVCIPFKKRWNFQKENVPSSLDKELDAKKEKEELDAIKAVAYKLQDSVRESIDKIIEEKASMRKGNMSLEYELQELEKTSQQGNKVYLRAVGKGKAIVENPASLKDQLALSQVELQETCSLLKERVRILEQESGIDKAKLKMVDASMAELEQQKQRVYDLQVRLAETEHQLCEGELLRKKLQNTILELKGNIRVFCRVRPLLADDDGVRQEASAITYPASLESRGRGINVLQNGNKHPFIFDKVFDHEASQEDIFFEASELVHSALDGYKVCIFAYGQTGSGKTYTMMGRSETPEHKGLIPRSLEQIFETIESLRAQGRKYKMQVSILEIYNETLRDLLAKKQKQYTISHDVDGNTHVSDLTIIDVRSSGQISSLLQQAAHGRSIGKTQMNEESSRSHFVFTLRISCVNESTDEHVQGVLNLIDLAGSERLSKSLAIGERLKETQAINKSLFALSDVINSLARKEEHVPFRNSKLTYLLQSSLGGNSKTLMVVNISPHPSSTGESLCSLRFAARVNACEVGVARRNCKPR